MLRVLINCPGGWSHGLDSPERGEGRWAQNLAKCLARSGRYDVSTCSGGVPTWGRGEVVPGVALLSEQEARDAGPYDLHFDAAWYDKKRPAAEAEHNFHVHFGFEPRLGVPFPEGHYLVYVLRRSEPKYFGEGRGNADRTFYLPAPFGEAMLPPDPSRRRVIHTMRGSDAPGRVGRFDALYEAVTRLRRVESIPFTWLSSKGLESPRHPEDRVVPMDAAWGIPYNEMRAELRGCGLNAALDGWSNILDCTVLGIPSLAWVGGIDDTAVDVASTFDLVLGGDAGLGRVHEVVRRLLSDAGLYVEYTRALQSECSDHVESRTLQLFDALVEKVMDDRRTTA